MNSGSQPSSLQLIPAAILPDLKARIGEIKQVYPLAVGPASRLFRIQDNAGGRHVLKIFVYDASAELSHTEQVTRFQREAQIHLTLNHPRIVKAIDYWSSDDHHCLLMENSSWPNLQTLIDQGQIFGYDEILQISEQLADAIGYLNYQGVVHRDIKPANLLISPSGELLLVDFGCARQIMGPSITQVRMLMGTLYYMSPEQLLGVDTLDSRSDLFSLGVILYQLLSGHLPFAAETPTDTIRLLLYAETPTLELSNGSLPNALGDIVSDLLQKDPDYRPTSAESVRHAIAACRQDPDFLMLCARQAAAAGHPQQAQSWCRQLLVHNDEKPEAWLLLAELCEQTGHLEEAFKSYTQLVRLGTADAGTYAKLAGLYTSQGAHEQALKMYQRAWVLNPDSFEYEFAIAKTLVAMERYPDAIESAQNLLYHYPTHPELQTLLGRIYLATQDTQAALPYLKQAHVHAPKDPDILYALATLHLESDHWEAAIAHYHDLVDLIPTHWQAWHNLGFAHYQVGQYSEAIAALGRALQGDHDLVQTHWLLGLSHESEGELDLATICLFNAIESRPSILDIYQDLASILRRQWRLNEAISVLELAIQLSIPRTASLYCQLGQAYREKGWAQRAHQMFGMAMRCSDAAEWRPFIDSGQAATMPRKQIPFPWYRRSTQKASISS